MFRFFYELRTSRYFFIKNSVKWYCLKIQKIKEILLFCKDLVNEKIKSQNLNNDFDKLTQELERVGINKEKLVMADHRQDEK